MNNNINLEQLLLPYSKSSDLFIHDKMLSLMDAYLKDPSSQNADVLDLAFIKYQEKEKDSRYFNMIKDYYVGLRLL